MQNNPLVSIIIPTYNRAHLISETLDSVLMQTYENWECIIVDDGSIDNSAEIIGNYVNKDTRFQYHHRPKDRPKGANTCRNYGFELSKGDYINWFDSDDIMKNTMIEQAVFDLKLSTALKFVLFDWVEFQTNINNIISAHKNYTQKLIEDYATWKINFGTWAIVWKREIIASYSFDETLSRAQDLDFNTRIFFNEIFEFKNMNTVGVFLRYHENRLTEDFNNMNINSLKSEVKVRRELINKLIKRKTEEKVIIESIEIFSIGLMKMVRGNYHNIFLYEVKKSLSFQKRGFQKLVWLSYLVFLTLVHKFFSKGDLKIKEQLKSFPISTIN